MNWEEENKDNCMLWRNKYRHWQYNELFIEWLKNNAIRFKGNDYLCEYIGMSRFTLCNILKKENIELIYDFGKFNSKFKAIYQDYNWCYQKYIIEGMSHIDMAKEANCSKRVIEKWVYEKHKLKNIERCNGKKFSQIQHDLLIGSIIGDGYIDKREKQSLFVVSHADNQRDYLFWKYEILKDICNKEPSLIKGSVKKFGDKEYYCKDSYRISTRIIRELETYRDLSISEVINQLNEFSLAVYILDDSSRSKYSWDLCFAEFSMENKLEFIDIMKNKFGLSCKMNKDDRYLRFNSESSKILDKIILRNIPNELDIIKYKILDKGLGLNNE